MTIQLPPDVEAIVKAKVASGAFASEAEVVTAAVRSVDAHRPLPTPLKWVTGIRTRLVETSSGVR